MKNWLLFLPLLIACADVKSPPPSDITIPEVLIAGEIHEPKPVEPTPSREDLLKPLFDGINGLAEYQLPFDEPRHEIGQQDGSLRPLWLQALIRGDKSYYFNNDKYYVYGKNGFPRPPEVCADFIVDALEYSSGTWYTNPKQWGKVWHVTFKVELRDAMKAQGLDARRVNELVAFFKSQPDNYQIVWAVDDPAYAPTNYWGGPQVTPVNGTGGLKEFLKEYDVQLGDIIIISGLAPWDHGKEIHNHSMFVTGLDKGGLVEYITGNDAWVRRKEIGLEMARAPKRKVKYIIRLTDKFLTNLQ